MGTQDASELLPGTLDLLILKTVVAGRMHGYGIAQRLKDVWLVGTGLGAVAFAEPGRAVPFETGASPSRHGTLNPSPHAEPGVQVSRTGLPRSHLRGRSDSGMTKLRVRQLEPCAAPAIAPVQPMSLAAAAQHSNPLQLDFTPNDVKSWLAVV